MAKIIKNCHINTPPIHSLFDLQQHNVPQNITFFMRIDDYENENILQSEKHEKSQFYCFHLRHIGLLFSKTLTVNGHP